MAGTPDPRTILRSKLSSHPEQVRVVEFGASEEAEVYVVRVRHDMDERPPDSCRAGKAIRHIRIESKAALAKKG